MSKEDFIKNIVEDLELINDLPFDKCDEDCEECESICEEYFREDALTQIEVLHRIAKREFDECTPKYRSTANVDIKVLCDVFGWTDFDFSEVTE